MRFCPFCNQELEDQTAHCVYCGKRLPSTPSRGPAGDLPKKTMMGMASPAGFQPPAPAAPPEAPAAPPAAPRLAPPPPVAPPRRADPSAPEKKTIFGYSGPPPSAPRPPAPAVPYPAAPASRGPADPTTPGYAGPAHAAPTILGATPPPAVAPRPPVATPPPPGMGPTLISTPAPPPPAPAMAPTMLGGVQPQAPAPPPPPGVAPTLIAPGARQEAGVAPTVLGTVPAVTGPHPAAAPAAAAAEPAAAPARPGPSAAAQRASLPAMPSDGPPGFFGGLPYWFSVIGARMKRGSVINLFRREIASEGKRLEEFLRDLGKRARELSLSAPPIDAEMQALLALEAQRDQTRAGNAELEAKLKAEEEAFNQQNQGISDRITAAQAKVNELGQTLKEQTGALTTAKTQLAAVDKELKTLAGQRDARRNEATKAKDPDKKQDLEQAAAEIAVAVGDKERGRELAAAEVAAAEAPVAETTATLTDWRGKLQAAQRELAEAKAALAAKQKETQGEQRKQAAELTRQEKEIAQKFLDLGRLLDGGRVPRPELAELYGRIDETRAGVADRERQIAELEAERDAFDRIGTRNGKILFFSILGLIVAIIVTLVILFTFVFD
jgi:hypothetical protein